jgi:hypothetical protein
MIDAALERKGAEKTSSSLRPLLLCVLCFFASFALVKPKLAESPSSEGWASAFNRDDRLAEQ